MGKLIQSIWTQLWLTGVVCLVLLALYTSLGRQLIPLIETKKADIEQALSLQLGVNVSMTALEGDWFWFSPTIKVNQLVIGNSKTGLVVDQIHAELDVSASLFYRVPVFDSIELSGVSLPIVQNESLTWHVAGLSLGSESKNDSEVGFWQGEKPLWLTLLGQQGEIYLDDWQIHIQRFAEPAKAINLLGVRLRNRGLQHWLDGEIELVESGAILAAQFEVTGDLWDLSQQNGKGFVELDYQSWQDWIPENNSSWELDEISVGAKLWVEVENGLLHSLDGYIDVPEFSLSKYDQHKDALETPKNLSFQQGRISLAGRRDQQDWHLWFNSDLTWLSEFTPFEPRGRLSWFPSLDNSLQLALNAINLEDVATWAEDFSLFAPAYTDFITNLKPKGLVDQVRINLLPQQDWMWSTELDLFDVSIESWNAIPAAKQLNGQVKMNATGGVLSIRDSDTFLHFANMYDQGWLLHDTTADVHWQINKNYLKLASPSINAQLNDTLLQGGFSFYTPLGSPKDTNEPSAKNLQKHINARIEPQLHLMLGIQNLDLRQQHTVVPNNIPSTISEFLNNNIKSGNAKQVSFVFAGSVDKNIVPFSQTIQMHADLQQASMTYMPEWPAIENAQASVMMDVPNVWVSVQDATTLGGQFVSNSTEIKVITETVNSTSRPINTEVQTESQTWLMVDGQVKGSASEGLKYLQQTPLKAVVNDAFNDWAAQGDLTTKLNARISLSGNPEANHIRVSSGLSNVDVTLNNLNLEFSQINGEVIFDTADGLSASNLQLNSFSGPAIANIESTKLDGGFDIAITANGKAELAPIKSWMPLFFMKPISGAFDYDLSFFIRPPQRGGIELNINTDLTGVEIGVPAPFGKSDQQQVPYSMQVSMNKDLRLNFKYGELANGVMALEDGQLKRGQIYLGAAQAYLPSDQGLSITGNIDHELEAQAWWDLWNDIKPKNDKDVAENISQPHPSLLSYINVSAPAINAWQQPMGATQIEGQHQWGRWNFELTSQMMKGKITMPDDLQNEAITMDLQYIHMPVSANAEEDIRFGGEGTVDTLVDFDPAWIPRLDLKVAEVYLGTSNFGRWDLSIRQIDAITKITVHDSDSKHLTMKGDIDWSKDENGHKTHLNLFRISSKNLGDAQRAFRKVASVESSNAKFDLDLTWQGSPVAFNYASLNGLAKVSIKEGLLASDNAGALRAFGVLNFASISRRLKLDFSDLYEQGVAFDVLRTRLVIEDGLITFADPILIDGPSAKFQSTGWVNMNTEELNQKLIVTFPITTSLPLVAVLAGFAPQVAGAIYVTEKLIGEELERFTSASYTVDGTIQNPKMTLDKAFDNDVKGKESRSFKNRFLDIFGLGDDD